MNRTATIAPQMLGPDAEPRGDAHYLAITSFDSVVAARLAMQSLARTVGFRSFDVTLATLAMSELARNVVEHAGRGAVTLQGFHRIERPPRDMGVVVIAAGAGPDIPTSQDPDPDRWTCVTALRRLAPNISVAVRDEITVVTMPMWPDRP